VTSAYACVLTCRAGKGVRICIEKGLENSGVPAEWVNYVNAHATSTKAGDMQEYKAITAIFGNNPRSETPSPARPHSHRHSHPHSLLPSPTLRSDYHCHSRPFVSLPAATRWR